MPRDRKEAVPVGRRRLGWTVSSLFALFLSVDAVTHMLRPQPVVEAFAKLGLSLRDSVPLGGLVLVLVLLYLLSSAASLAALLLTGYLGGAVALHLRIADGVFPLLIPVLIVVGLWAGLALRKPHVLRLLTGAE